VNADFETPLAALLAWWQANCAFSLTADATDGQATLANVSSVAGLFAGLPVTGPGVPNGATIAAVDTVTRTVTLSDQVSGSTARGAFNAGFQTFGRRVKHWTQVEAQPALFLRRIGATDDADEFFTVTTLECQAWIYCDAGQDPDFAPDTGLTALERLVRQSFVADTDYGDPRFTLNRTVHWCRVEGRTLSSAGDQGPQAKSMIPVRITLLPS